MRTKKINGRIHIQPPGASEWYPMECLTQEGKRPKVIEQCIYNYLCVGGIGQQIPTCNRWRRKYRKLPNRDPKQLSLV